MFVMGQGMIRMPNKIYLLLVALIIVFFSSCSKNQAIDIKDLLQNASQYNGQIITVKGCYFLGFELEIIGPCNDFKLDEGIWIEHYSQLEEMDKYLNNSATSLYKKPERKPTVEEKQREVDLKGPAKSVVMRGEFQSSSSSQFGHLGKYRYQFIIHRVLKVAEFNPPSHH
jgi:hypothetical protein